MHLSQRQQAGFTLIEVMITIFVVAVGLLSAAALQVASKKAAFEAVQRSTANTLAQDIIERMRGNAGQLAVYAPGGALTINKDNVPASQDCDSITQCTAQQLVANDLANWWRGLDGANEQIVEGSTTKSAGGLRTPTGCITRAAGSCAVKVVIAWRGVSPIDPDPSNLADPTSDLCGSTNPDYKDPDSSNATNYRYRRVLVVNANLGEQSPCPP